MDEMTQQMLYAIVVPAVVAFAIVLPFPRHADRGAFAIRMRLPVVLALPVLLAFIGLYGPPWAERAEQWHSLAYLVGVSAMLGMVMAFTSRKIPVRSVIGIILAVGATAAIWPVLARESTPAKLLPVGAILALYVLLEPLVVRRKGASMPACAGIAVGAAALIVLISGFMKLSIPTGALSIALLACAACALWRRKLSLGDGGLAVIVPMLVCAPYVAWLYMTSYGDSLPVTCFVLPALGLALVWIGELGFITKQPAWVGVLVRLLPVVAAGGAAVALALMPTADEDDGGGSDDPYRDLYGMIDRFDEMRIDRDTLEASAEHWDVAKPLELQTWDA